MNLEPSHFIFSSRRGILTRTIGAVMEKNIWLMETEWRTLRFWVIQKIDTTSQLLPLKLVNEYWLLDAMCIMLSERMRCFRPGATHKRGKNKSYINAPKNVVKLLEKSTKTWICPPSQKLLIVFNDNTNIFQKLVPSGISIALFTSSVDIIKYRN